MLWESYASGETSHFRPCPVKTMRMRLAPEAVPDWLCPVGVSRKMLASWYLQMAQHLEAGLTLAEAIDHAGGPPAGDRSQLAAQIVAGSPLDDVLRGAPKWLPQADRVFLSAAAKTGRLPQTLQNLAEHHRNVGANQLKALLGMAYPLGVVHLAVLIIPLTGMIDFEQGLQWNTLSYLSGVLTVLLPLWAVIGLVVFLAASHSPLLPRLLRLIPILRGYSKAQALADFSHALGTFLDAGVPVKRAWQGAAALARDPELHKAERSFETVLDQGQDPGSLLKEHPCFPPDFVALYLSGAKSGQLDSNLLRLGKQYQEKANSRMTLAALIYPSLLSLAVAVWIALAIFRIFGSYLEALGNFMT